MTVCNRCRKQFGSEAALCPFCGERRPQASGTFHTSTVLISTRGEEWVCRTVEEVPPHLRRRLLKSTNGANSATILIADRRGRIEIARALKKLPASAQRRLRHSIEGAPAGFRRLAPLRRNLLLVFAVMALLAAIAIVFSHRW